MRGTAAPHIRGEPLLVTTAAPQAVTQPEADKNGHIWVGAAYMDLTVPQAKRANLRGSIRLPKQTQIMVVETYCRECRRPFDDVADEECTAASSTEHLRGGPIGVRKKRKHVHNCELLGCPGTGDPAAVPAAVPPSQARACLAAGTNRARCVTSRAGLRMHLNRGRRVGRQPGDNHPPEGHQAAA